MYSLLISKMQMKPQRILENRTHPDLQSFHYLKIALLRSGTNPPDISILIIDDTSTDGTPEYLRGIRDPRFSYILNESNLGLAGNINKGIPLVPGNVEWCTILGDDDMMDKDFIRAMLDAVLFFSPKSIVHGHRIIIDKDGDTFDIKGPFEESAGISEMPL
jgi:GT2 family glycosyltransferase